MKKFLINSKFNQSIRQDGLYYNLDDLYRCTTLNDNYRPWVWAQKEDCTRDISRRGWFSKKSWAKATVMLEYANFLSPVLYRDAIQSLGAYRVEDRIAILGKELGCRIDPVIQRYYDRLERDAEKVTRETDKVLDLMRSIPGATDSRSFSRNIALRHKETGRITHPRSRSMGPSVTHRSEPDYLTQAMVMNAVMDDTPTRHDVCHSHDSSSSSSWSGDSGSYDSGSSGGCD